MTTADITRRPAGSTSGGQFSHRSNSAPLDSLGPLRAQTLVRVGAGDVQVVYERDPGTDRVRITVLLRDPEMSEREGAGAWVEEGSVLTRTPAASDAERMASVATNQVSRLWSSIKSGDDEHESVDAFLAEIADRRDPFITRGLRRRHGEELEGPDWPSLDNDL